MSKFIKCPICGHKFSRCNSESILKPYRKIALICENDNCTGRGKIYLRINPKQVQSMYSGTIYNV